MKFVAIALLSALPAFSQKGFHKPESLPASTLERNMERNTAPVSFKDLSRASKAFNNYFSRPENLQPKRFTDGRFATNVDIFESVNDAIDARRYPEVKW